MRLEAGLRGRAEAGVTDADTAIALGSGDVPVLGTPRLLALAEAATVDALRDAVDPETTSVGSDIRLEHLRPSPTGTTVVVEAVLTAVDGRTVQFDVVATDDAGALVGRGQVTRVLVDRRRFLSKLGVEF